MAADRFVALMPLRGGSKSIPLKNIAPIAGRPLCAWALAAARDSGVFDRIVVSTDSPAIARVVEGLGLAVEVVERPAELATDTASTESVMSHFASTASFETLVTVQATSPCVRAADFIAARDLYARGGYDSLVTGVRVKRFYWSDAGLPLNYDFRSRPMRQQFAGSIMENGAFYFTSRTVLEATGCRLGGKVAVYEMAPDSAVEIDEPQDWREVETTLRRRSGDGILRALRAVLVDVDGTLTDGGMYYTADGEAMKKFSTRDAVGLRLLTEAGLTVAVVTQEDSPIVAARMRKLGIDRYYPGVTDKLAFVGSLCSELGIGLGETAFIGDDIGDLAVMREVGFAASPADALGPVLAVAHHVSPHRGGHGAVREIAETILAASGGEQEVRRKD